MAADYIRLHIRVWRDPWFRALDQASKLLFLYLISSGPEVGLCGIYEFNPDIAGGELADPLAASRLDQFVYDGKVRRDRRWVWVVNYSLYQVYTLKQYKSARADALRLTKKTSLGAAWLECYPGFDSATGQCSLHSSAERLDAPNEAQSAQTPLFSSPLHSSHFVGADAPNLFLPLAEEVQAFVAVLAAEGYPVDPPPLGVSPEALASAMEKSGLPLVDLRENITFAQHDSHWRGELCQQKKWLNGGMFRTLQLARLKEAHRNGGRPAVHVPSLGPVLVSAPAGFREDEA